MCPRALSLSPRMTPNPQIYCYRQARGRTFLRPKHYLSIQREIKATKEKRKKGQPWCLSAGSGKRGRALGRKRRPGSQEERRRRNTNTASERRGVSMFSYLSCSEEGQQNSGVWRRPLSNGGQSPAGRGVGSALLSH